MKSNKFFKLAIMYLSILCFLILTPYQLTSQSKAELQQAIKSLNTFKSSLSQLKTAAAIPLGPYPLNAKFTWCSKSFIFCIENTTETFKGSADFSWIKSSLRSAISQAEANANNFNRSFAPTQRWIDQLPAFSREFTQNANSIEAVQNELDRGIGPNDDQKRRVTNALQKLCDNLAQSKRDVEVGTRSLSIFLQNQSTYRQSIKNTMDASAARQESELTRLMNDCRKKCSRQETYNKLTASFNVIKSTFAVSTASINQSYSVVEQTSRAAEKGVSQLLAAVLSNNSDLQTILGEVKEARTDELGSFIQAMHLGTAQIQWESLAAGI
ncbi:MAG: hypothetical protein ACJATI_004011 [Halioglobus sp.]|jgi:hypothetical protein